MTTTNPYFDDRIADWLEDDPTVAPAQVLDTVLAAVPSISQRRGLAAWMRGTPFRVAPFRLVRLAIVVASLVLAAVLGLAISGGPNANPSPTAAGQATFTSPVHEPPATVPIAPTATPSTVTDPLPAGIFGAWYHPAPAFMTFFRAGDPYCVDALHTDLDCMLWQPVGQVKENGIVTLEGNVIALAMKSGYCTGVTSHYSMTLSGDALSLTELPGGCQGGSYSLIRAGTGGTPTSPPE
jgi:hypothetical protein